MREASSVQWRSQNTQSHVATLALQICNLHDTGHNCCRQISRLGSARLGSARLGSAQLGSASSIIYVFSCKCFVSSVGTLNNCWQIMNSRVAVQCKWTHIKDQCVSRDSSVGILSYWLADRGNVAWSQHWQGICTYTKRSNTFWYNPPSTQRH
jgi:hypothetical protein